MTNTVFPALRERLDLYSIGFPATPSGVELRILEMLFSDQEAEFFLQLTPFLETPETVATRSGLESAQVRELLESMADKGLIFRRRNGAEAKYAAVPFVVGSWEFQVGRMGPDLARLFEQYFDEAFHRQITGAFMRPIPVNRSVPVAHAVATYEDSREILKQHKFMAVANCICRVQQGLIGKGCEKPVEACFVFGSHGKYYLERGMARAIDLEEGLHILEKAEEAGLVTQPFNSQNPGGMCNCCGCCCGILRGLNRTPKPADLVVTNYRAAVDTEACVGCQVCLERCQMGAITMTEDDVAVVNPDRCIGCGLCVTTCGAEAMHLELKPEGQRRTVPKSAAETMLEIANRRGKGMELLFK